MYGGIAWGIAWGELSLWVCWDCRRDYTGAYRAPSLWASVIEVIFIDAGKTTPCARLGSLISRNGRTTADATAVGDIRAMITTKKILRSGIFV